MAGQHMELLICH